MEPLIHQGLYKWDYHVLDFCEVEVRCLYSEPFIRCKSMTCSLKIKINVSERTLSSTLRDGSTNQ